MHKTCGIIYFNFDLTKILLVKNMNWYTKKYIWSLPKGTFEQTDKNIEECALREFYEETKIKLRIYEKTKIRLMGKIKNVFLYFNVYVQNKFKDSKSLYKIGSKEIKNIMWVSVKILKKLRKGNYNYTIKLLKNNLENIINSLNINDERSISTQKHTNK